VAKCPNNGQADFGFVSTARLEHRSGAQGFPLANRIEAEAPQERNEWMRVSAFSDFQPERARAFFWPFQSLISLDHRAVAALDAISDRLAALSLLALARPPLSPPNRPNATAAGFFFRCSGAILSNTALASCCVSFCFFLLERLGMEESLQIAPRKASDYFHDVCGGGGVCVPRLPLCKADRVGWGDEYIHQTIHTPRNR
jgi:hypothetical protein